MYRKNTAGQFIVVQLLLTASGAVATGLSPAARRCIDGTFAAGGGTFTEDGTTGSYKYALAQADTNGNDISIIVTATGAIPVVVNLVTTAADPTDGVHFGLSSLPNTAVTTNGSLLTSGTGTDQLHVSSGHVANVDTLTTYTGNTPQTGDAYARLGAPAGASTAADIAAVKSDTGTILTDVNTGAGAIYTRLGAPAGASMSADIAAVKSDIDAGVNVTEINGNATAAANVSKANQAIVRGTCSGGTTATAVCSSIATPASLTDAGQLIGRTIIFDSNTTTANLQGQASNITASTTGSTPTITFTAMTHAPANGDTFSVV